MKNNKYVKSFLDGVKAHKILTAVIVVTCAIGGFEMVSAAKNAGAATQYVVSPVVNGSIVQSVNGSGQVTSANQIDIASQASGAITSIDVKVGDHVAQGDLIATIDNTNARNSLMNAKLSLAQLTEPAKPGDVTNADNALKKAYSDAQSSIRSTFTDLQTVIPGLDVMLYGQNGFLGTSNSVFLTSTGQQYRTTAGLDYDEAKADYNRVLTEYNGLSTQPATSSVKTLVSDSYEMVRKVAAALEDVQATVTYITTNETQYQPGGASTAKSNVASWLNLINADVSSIGSADNGIVSNENSLNNLLTGADPLAVQSSELSVNQAQITYNNYFIRAPVDGVVGRIPVSLYSQASGGTVIATVIGDQKVANISLDEVDADKVHTGQSATITFDAINGFTATGTVNQADLVGTVAQGVVSYNMKIAINTADDRIRPGMSVNVKIITNEKDGVLIVPSGAIKTQGGQSYVQVLDRPQTQASSTKAYGGANSTTTGMRRQMSLTMTSPTPPHNVTVVTGLSDDQNTEIVSGLDLRQLVVTRTIAGSSAATAAPSILNSLGGGARTGAAAGGTFRAAGGRIGG